MAYATFSSTSTVAGPVLIDGPFNIDILQSPSGATVKLQKSYDGITFYDVYISGSLAAYSSQGMYTVYNFGSAYYQLVCPTYGSANFIAGISSGRAKF